MATAVMDSYHLWFPAQDLQINGHSFQAWMKKVTQGPAFSWGNCTATSGCLGKGRYYLQWCSHWWVPHAPVISSIPMLIGKDQVKLNGSQNKNKTKIYASRRGHGRRWIDRGERRIRKGEVTLHINQLKDQRKCFFLFSFFCITFYAMHLCFFKLLYQWPNMKKLAFLLMKHLLWINMSLWHLLYTEVEHQDLWSHGVNRGCYNHNEGEE